MNGYSWSSLIGVLRIITVIASIRCTREMKVIVVKTQIAMHFFLIVGSPGASLLNIQCITTQYIILYYSFRNMSQPTNTNRTQRPVDISLIRKHRILKSWDKGNIRGCTQKKRVPRI